MIKHNKATGVTKVQIPGLTEGRDFTVSTLRGDKKSTLRVIITGKGNYTGTVQKLITIEGDRKDPEKNKARQTSQTGTPQAEPVQEGSIVTDEHDAPKPYKWYDTESEELGEHGLLIRARTEESAIEPDLGRKLHLRRDLLKAMLEDGYEWIVFVVNDDMFIVIDLTVLQEDTDYIFNLQYDEDDDTICHVSMVTDGEECEELPENVLIGLTGNDDRKPETLCFKPEVDAEETEQETEPETELETEQTEILFGDDEALLLCAIPAETKGAFRVK